MTCLRCRRDTLLPPIVKNTSTPVRPARRCAFDDAGNFTAQNWNCATLNALRDRALPRILPLGGGSFWSVVIPAACQSVRGRVVVGGDFGRGRAEWAAVDDEGRLAGTFTVAIAEAVLESLKL